MKDEKASNMNSVVWFNVPSDDLDRATAFYRYVFGWDIQPLSVEKQDVLNYHTALTGESDANLNPVKAGVVNAPKDFADRFFNVQQWTEMPKGGHFAAMEQPELLAEDIIKFVVNVQNQR